MLRVLFYLVAALPLSGASSAALQVNGRIPCAGYIASEKADGGLLIENMGAALRVHAPGGRTNFALSLRTNCSYTLAVSSPAPIQVKPLTVAPAAGSGHLTATALKPAITPVAVTPGAQPVCVQGRRVSNGGNNLTQDNA